MEANPEIMSLDVFRLAKQKGYSGGTSKMYKLVAELRPRDTALLMRFEGLPGPPLLLPGGDYLTSDRLRAGRRPRAPLTTSGAASMGQDGQQLEYRSNSGAVYSCMSRSIFHAAMIAVWCRLALFAG